MLGGLDHPGARGSAVAALSRQQATIAARGKRAERATQLDAVLVPAIHLLVECGHHDAIERNRHYGIEPRRCNDVPFFNRVQQRRQ